VQLDGGLLLRPAKDDDRSFLYDLHRLAMREYVDATWGWSEPEQEERFRRAFDPRSIQIVVQEGRDIGALTVIRAPDELVLGNIEILPALQGKGIGSRVVRVLLAEADASRIPLRLQVLKTNPRARSLYERLGLRVVSETVTHDVMRTDPAHPPG
jgi:ribosomal protein S18 acetylase RimI-like enzyme